VTRTRSAEDRRVVFSALTERGEATVADRQRRMEERWLGAMQEFSDEELASAAKVLHRVADVFDSLSRESPEPAASGAAQPR